MTGLVIYVKRAMAPSWKILWEQAGVGSDRLIIRFLERKRVSSIDIRDLKFPELCSVLLSAVLNTGPVQVKGSHRVPAALGRSKLKQRLDHWLSVDSSQSLPRDSPRAPNLSHKTAVVMWPCSEPQSGTENVP